MATASSRQRFVQPPQKIMLTELQIKLNQRRDNSASPGGSPQFAGEKSLSGGDSPPTGSPKLKRPVVKSRSLSSGNRLKITASPKLGKKSQSKPILKAQTSKNERSTFAQSLSHSTTSRVNIEAIRDVVAVGDDVEIPPPAIRDIRPHTKSLGNAQVRHVAPPPTKPPPMLAASQKTAVKDTKKGVSKTLSGRPPPPPSDTPPSLSRTVAIKKRKLRKKKKLSNDNSVQSELTSACSVDEESSATPTSVVEGEVATTTYRYQNVFDFDSQKNKSEEKYDQSSKMPKKPKPLPRTNSISSSSTFRTSDIDSGQDSPSSVKTDQSASSSKVTSGPTVSMMAQSFTPSALSSRDSQDDNKVCNDKSVLSDQRQDPPPKPAAGNVSSRKENKKRSVKRLDGRKITRQALRRQTTKREVRQLRNGVCSDSETKPYSSDEDDDYITMNPAVASHLLNLSLSSSTHSLDPRASGYYLKILPSDYQPGNDTTTNEALTRSKRAASEEPLFYGEFGKSLAIKSDLTLSGPGSQLTRSELKRPPVSGLTLSELNPSTLQQLVQSETTPGSPGNDYVDMNIPWFSNTFGVKGQQQSFNRDSNVMDSLSNWIVAPGNRPAVSEGLPLASSAVAIGNHDSLKSQSLPVHHKQPTSQKASFPGEPPSLPRGNSPLIKNQSGLQVARPARVLQYSDVTIHPVDTLSDQARLPRKRSIPQKFKYQTVQLTQSDSTAHPSQVPPPSHTSQPSQPLPIPKREPLFVLSPQEALPTPSQPHTLTSTNVSQERIYYVTTSSLVGSHPNPSHTITAPPLTGSLPRRPAIWHQYVEIDTDEIANAVSQNDLPDASNQPIGLQTSHRQSPDHSSRPIGLQTSHHQSPDHSSRSIGLQTSHLQSPDHSTLSSQTGFDSSPYKDNPPVVPDRPEDLDDWADTRERWADIVSGDYSYTPVFGQDISGLQWMGKHRRTVAQSGKVFGPSSADAATAKTPSTINPPPSVPPKTASLLREIGLHPFKGETPEPYLNPVSIKRKTPNDEATPRSGRSSPSKVVSKLIGQKKRTDNRRMPPPVPPPYKYKPTNRSIHAASSAPSLIALDVSDRKYPERALIGKSAVPSPSLHAVHESQQDCASFRKTSAPSPNRLELQHESVDQSPVIVNSSKVTGRLDGSSTQSEFNISMCFPVTNEDSNRSPPPTEVSFHFSPPPLSPPPVLKTFSTSRDPLWIGSPTLTQRSESNSSLTANSSNNNNFDTDHEGGSESPSLLDLKDLGMEPGSCLCDLESHVDEHSLAVIAQNRGEIVRRLSQRRDKDSISNFDTSGLGQGEIELGHGGMESGRGGMESRHTDTHVPVPTLDRVLLELNSILRNKLCSEKDLIQAIENQLNIQLRPQDDRVLSQPREVANKDSEEYQIEDVISEVDDITVTSSVEEGAGLVKTHSYENLKEWLDTTDSNQLSLDDDAKPRSGTFIVYDSDEADSESSPSPHLIPSTGQIIHSRTQSSPVQDALPWQPGVTPWTNVHPRSASNPVMNRVTPLIKVDNSIHGNDVGRYRSASDFVTMGSHGNTDCFDNNGSRDDDQSFLSPTVRGGRSYSNGWDQSRLKRTNAQRRPSASAVDRMSVGSVFSNGQGLFTHRGGKLTNVGSGIEIVVPEGAIPKGKRQKLWFEVVQTTFDPAQPDEKSRSWSDSSSSYESTVMEKKDRRIQLSPLLLIGPSDAVFNQPIRIKLPHCLPYRNNSWHLQVFGRAQTNTLDEWAEISNTMGLVDLSLRKHKMKSYKNSAYQMHIDYTMISTTELGYFKLTGRPIRNGSHSAKRMLASVFLKTADQDKNQVQLEVFITDALKEHVQALEHSVTTPTYQCLQRNVPILCFGDGRDIEMMICCHSNSTPLGSKVIPFGQFWRQKIVGQSHVSFQLNHTLLNKSRTLTLKIQQAGAEIIHETNFLVPENEQ